MSNTQLRIISALILVIFLSVILYMGYTQSMIFIAVVGLICIDEMMVNFIKVARTKLVYIFTQLIFVLSFIYINILAKSFSANMNLSYFALSINLMLVAYLFFTTMEDQKFVNVLKSTPILILFMVLPHLSALASIFYWGSWIKYLVVFLCICFGMDTGAWFFGKNFGKRKLWPSVSPNKTIEGFIGGALTSGVLGTGLWLVLFGSFSVTNFVIFIILGMISQVGDLIQSKFKRQVKIKDSSSLIPGHGGVYDRIDSLIFSIPFYAIFVQWNFN